MNKIISILGTGWLGMALVKRFVEQGCHVKASTTTAARLGKLDGMNARSYLVDIAAPSQSLGAFLESELLIVNIPGSNPDDFKRLVDAIKRSPARHVLFTSSTSVYRSDAMMVTESNEFVNTGHPLYRIEQMFLNDNGFDATVLRLAGLVGGGRHPGRFFGDSRVIRSPLAPINLIHRDDVVGIISKVVQRDIWGEVFNCCSDTHPIKQSFYSKAAAAIGMAPPQVQPDSSPNTKIVSNDKVKQILQYKFVHPDLQALYGA